MLKSSATPGSAAGEVSALTAMPQHNISVFASPSAPPQALLPAIVPLTSVALPSIRSEHLPLPWLTPLPRGRRRGRGHAGAMSDTESSVASSTSTSVVKDMESLSIPDAGPIDPATVAKAEAAKDAANADFKGEGVAAGK